MIARGRDLSLVVLAAGAGRRFGGLKQLEPVGPGGAALLEYSVYDALRAGFSRVVLVVRPGTEPSFLERFGDRLSLRAPFRLVAQTSPAHRAKPWGTGHAVLAAAPAIEAPFAVVNADDFYGPEAFAALHSFLSAGAADPLPVFAMVGFELGPTLSRAGSVSRALCDLDDRGGLRGIVEVREIWKRGSGGFYRDEDGAEIEVAADRLVSMNIWGLTPEIFPPLESCFREFQRGPGRGPEAELLVPDVVARLVAEGRARVEVLRAEGRWCGITYPGDLGAVRERLAEMIERGDYPRDLWA